MATVTYKKINCFRTIWNYLYQLPIIPENNRTYQLKKQQKEKELIAESAVLLNQDEDFMQMIETGLVSAHAKRIEIYNVIKSVSKSGSMSLSKVEQCLPKEENFLQHGGIRKIMLGRFSISLQPNTYALYRQGEKNNSVTHDTIGLHLPNTIWNIVSPKLSGQFLNEVIAHEDRHSLVEGFFQERKNATQIQDSLADLLTFVLTNNNLTDTNTYHEKINSISTYLLKFMDATIREEIIVQLFDYRNYDHLDVLSTLCGHIEQFHQRLNDMQGIDKDVDKLLEQLHEIHSGKTIMVKIKALFDLISQKKPERFDDLFFYLILSPPSEINLIENTVKNWIK